MKAIIILTSSLLLATLNAEELCKHREHIVRLRINPEATAKLREAAQHFEDASKHLEEVNRQLEAQQEAQRWQQQREREQQDMDMEATQRRIKELENTRIFVAPVEKPSPQKVKMLKREKEQAEDLERQLEQLRKETPN